MECGSEMGEWSASSGLLGIKKAITVCMRLPGIGSDLCHASNYFS